MSKTVTIIDCDVLVAPLECYPSPRDSIYPSVGQWRARAKVNSPTILEGRGHSPAEAMEALRRTVSCALDPKGHTELEVQLRLISIRFPKDRGGVEPQG